ncbi:MAG: formate/nitrite transporter family protein [Lachnospiraceae bacterium]|nr:formate/nitrite transporter family protein [Lachnospiraceae bacterium]
MKSLKTFLLAVLAGLSISIGGIVFLSCESKVAGAIFFTIGLFTVCTFGLNLFTGKVCYALDNKASYILDLILIWCGNFTGCILTGLAMRLTRVAPTLIETAQGICEKKLSGSPLSTIILGLFCNICIYIAVDGYKNNPHEIGKYLALLFGVTVFILCGFEHCVANMFYFSMAGIFTGNMIVFLLLNTLGNIIGGLLIPCMFTIIKK